MNKLHIVYTIHAAMVAATAFIMHLAGTAEWFYALAVALPLILSIFPKYGHLSYGINIRILFPVSVGLFCVALYHATPSLLGSETELLGRYGVSNPGQEISQKFFVVNDTFKDSVSVLYAICAAFLLWKGLVDFDELKHVLYDEVNEVVSISNYLEFFKESGEHTKRNMEIVQAVRGDLYVYISNILQDAKIVVNASNTKVIAKIAGRISRLNAHDTNDQISLEEIMKAVTRLSNLRSKRKVCIEKKMSPYILSLMFLMSLAMISTFFGDATGIITFDYAYVFLMSAFYTALFMTLIDLSSPFEGYWSIKLEAVQEALQDLEKFKPDSVENPLS